MTKNLKTTYILMFIFSGILVAFKTLSNFLGGVAINFVALLGIMFAVLIISLTSHQSLKHILDLFITACIFCVLELIIYFACEFGNGEAIRGFIVYQNIISGLGLLFLIYTCIRFTLEMTGKKISFLNKRLSTKSRTIKDKKTKEIINGSLEDKPNNKLNDNHSESVTETEESTIIIETEE